MVRMRGLLWLCAGALAPAVGNATARATQDRSTVQTLAFGRYALVLIRLCDLT